MSDGNGGVGASLGGTIGSRVAGHLTKAMTEARVRLGPHQASIVQVILRDFTNHVSDEIRGVMGPLWRQIADSPDAGPTVRALAHKLGTERGQAWTWIAGTSTSLTMGGGLGTLITNELQPVLGPAIRANPHMPLSPADASAAVARGLFPFSFGYGDAGQAGIDESRFGILKDLNTNVLSAEVLLELFGRGWISEGRVLQFFRRAGWEPNHAQQMLPLARTWISARDGGSMWNRSIVDIDELREIVVRNGHHPSDAEKYAELTGEPLPAQDLMTAQRRGIIDAARARRGWVQGPVRNEWFDVAQELQYAPMSTVDAADAVNQNHMPLLEARQIAEWNGLIADHFDILIQNAGLPPGVELASEALNRGLLTEAEFRQAFLESRLKNKYVDLYTELRYRVMPQETVRRLYRKGSFTRDEAAKRLGWAGFSPADAEALLASEDTDTDDTTRDLTKAEVVSLYTDRAIDRAQAADMLAALGYAPGEVEWLLTISELRRARRFADAVTTRVRAGYVANRLDTNTAVGILDRLGIPPDQRDELLSLWDLEKLAVVRVLTPAQVKTALRKGKISEAEAMSRLTDQGYGDDDALILLTT